MISFSPYSTFFTHGKPYSSFSDFSLLSLKSHFTSSWSLFPGVFTSIVVASYTCSCSVPFLSMDLHAFPTSLSPYFTTITKPNPLAYSSDSPAMLGFDDMVRANTVQLGAGKRYTAGRLLR